MATQEQIAKSMIEQLRALDPSISAEVGTPERRIIDTVALAIADSQVDLTLLQGAFDIDSKFGLDLDNMLSILGFGRQQGVRAKGYITFSRNEPSLSDVVIPTGTSVFSPTGGDAGTSVTFRTTTSGVLEAGATTVIIPIEAVQAGTIGNVPANSITETYGAPVYGITSVNNDYPTSGGRDSESDTQLKARFTTAGPFRNLAGTQDQFMALALATVSKKATVIGPISKYSEYVQVPFKYDGDGGNGNPVKVNEFTTALSTNTNAKHVYDNLPYFVINDQNISPIYYAAGYDFVLNLNNDSKNKGDTYRDNQDDPGREALGLDQPNVTFTNVYTGLEDKPTGAIAPGDVLLFEYSYMSKASRNSYAKNVLNCVDVYVNGEKLETSNITIPRPGSSVPTLTFNKDQTSAYYVDNFRRANEPGHRPIAGNIFTPLYHQPAVEVPNQINLSNTSFTKGIHYWLVEETTSLNGTIRARNGIEWSTTIRGQTSLDNPDGPYTGEYITNSFTTAGYLKTALPASSSVSTDLSSTENYTVTNKARTGTSPVIATLTIGSHYIRVGDTIAVSNVDGDYNTATALVTARTSTTISYHISNASAAQGSSTGTVTLKIIKSNNGTPAETVRIKTSSTAGFPDAGYILIGSEILSYSSKDGSNFIINGRGQFNTPKIDILMATATKALVLIEIDQSTQNVPLTDFIMINNEVMKYVRPSTVSSNLINITSRASQGTYVAAHSAQSQINFLSSTVDKSILIDNYQYDSNIGTLQALLESNKQVTTDVLAHKSKVRYFKPDITIMYSPRASKASVNESIRVALNGYFDSLYFGAFIQLSDILQTIHNVVGVDNVRWSKDNLDAEFQAADSERDTRPRLTETDKFGNPISAPIFDLIKIGNGVEATCYDLYFPYPVYEEATVLDPPTLSIESNTNTGSSSKIYYYVVTAFNQRGETIKSNQVQTPSIGNTSQVSLVWTEVDGAEGYRIYRSETSNSWTGSNAYCIDEEIYEETKFTDEIANTALTDKLPPVVGTATVNSANEVETNFTIQYGNNQPVSISTSDLRLKVWNPTEEYSKDDVVLFGDKYYVSRLDDNIDNSPASTSGYWSLDTNNQIGLTLKLNKNGTVVTATKADGFANVPLFDSKLRLTLSSINDQSTLSIVSSNVNEGFGIYNNDFQINDGELASLPMPSAIEGVNDLNAIMTIREKSQNTWNNVS